METNLWGAVLGGCITLTALYVSAFVAAASKRFHDGSAAAAGLAGELAAYRDPLDELRGKMKQLLDLAEQGERNKIVLRQVELPVDRFFVAAVPNLGFLGSDTVEAVAYVYGVLNGYRAALLVLARDHKSMDDDELKIRLAQVVELIETLEVRGTPLIEDLRNRARQPFFQAWALTGR